MDLPECPPGAEGYEDSVTIVPQAKPDLEECTKIEQEFQEHLTSLRIRLEDGSTRPMVERNGRDGSGRWIYLCFPCSAVCSGESVLQNHISGKKHKLKIASREVWAMDTFTKHPYLNDKSGKEKKAMPESVPVPPRKPQHPVSALEQKFGHYRDVRCHIEDIIDPIAKSGRKTNMVFIGLEYLVEHPPEEAHHEPNYVCVLCDKRGQPKTIINHLTCFAHRANYMMLHYPTAYHKMDAFRGHTYREGIVLAVTRFAQRVEEKYGRLRPVNVERVAYEDVKNEFHQWITQGFHFSEKNGESFEEVIDADLIQALRKNINVDDNTNNFKSGKDFMQAARQQINTNVANKRSLRPAASAESLSDVSGDEATSTQPKAFGSRRHQQEPPAKRERAGPRYTRKVTDRDDKKNAPNYQYKVKLSEERTAQAIEQAGKTLAYHDKHPEKHPLYPEEWKKFWNRRYKEVQAEGKDPAKFDYKPEWIVYWTKRMKELHDEELRASIAEIYRKLTLTPPPERGTSPPPRDSPPPRRRPSPPPRRREPSPRRRLPSPRRRAPSPRRNPPLGIGQQRRSPPPRSTPPRRSPPPRRFSPARREPHKTRSRSPIARGRSNSPLSRREQQPRNQSPAPALQTVLISDEELQPDDGLSDWDSSSDVGSLRNSPRGSVRSSARRSVRSATRDRERARESPAPAPGPGGDTVIGTLRLLVALEEYLGSLGPRVVALLTEALRCEKLQANSSERLLDTCADLLETAKEKLKGATQAGLVPSAALSAARQCVVRVAALLHEADKRRPAAAAAAPAASAVCREDIARQMAAALVQQGKTDVSAAELAQLVDAVVAAAEAKRGAAVPAAAPTAALQLLQAAYDDPAPAPAAPPAPAPAADAMDGLSDSDLETLLKNFGELSADEQQSLVAYLRKLEAGDPRRVERLRSFVGEAMPSTAPGANPSAPPPPAPAPAAPAHDSDDDDYTVEDVVRTATRQVLEKNRKQEQASLARGLETRSAAAGSFSGVTSSTAELLAMLANVAPKVALASALATPARAVEQPRSFGDSWPQQQQQQTYNRPQPFINQNQQQSYKNPQTFDNQNNYNNGQQNYNNPQQRFNNQPYKNNQKGFINPWQTQPNFEQQQQFNSGPRNFSHQNFNNPRGRGGGRGRGRGGPRF